MLDKLKEILSHKKEVITYLLIGITILGIPVSVDLINKQKILRSQAVVPFVNIFGDSVKVYNNQKFTTSQNVQLEVTTPFDSSPVPTQAPTSAPTTAPTSAPTTAPTAAPTTAPTTAPAVTNKLYQSILHDDGHTSWVRSCEFDPNDARFGVGRCTAWDIFDIALEPTSATDKKYRSVSNYLAKIGTETKLVQSLLHDDGHTFWARTAPLNPQNQKYGVGAWTAWTQYDLAQENVPNAPNNNKKYRAVGNYDSNIGGTNYLIQSLLHDDGHTSWVRRCNYNSNSPATGVSGCTAWSQFDLAGEAVTDPPGGSKVFRYVANFEVGTRESRSLYQSLLHDDGHTSWVRKCGYNPNNTTHGVGSCSAWDKYDLAGETVPNPPGGNKKFRSVANYEVGKTLSSLPSNNFFERLAQGGLVSTVYAQNVRVCDAGETNCFWSDKERSCGDYKCYRYLYSAGTTDADKKDCQQISTALFTKETKTCPAGTAAPTAGGTTGECAARGGYCVESGSNIPDGCSAPTGVGECGSWYCVYGGSWCNTTKDGRFTNPNARQAGTSASSSPSPGACADICYSDELRTQVTGSGANCSVNTRFTSNLCKEETDVGKTATCGGKQWNCVKRATRGIFWTENSFSAGNVAGPRATTNYFLVSHEDSPAAWDLAQATAKYNYKTNQVNRVNFTFPPRVCTSCDTYPRELRRVWVKFVGTNPAGQTVEEVKSGDIILALPPKVTSVACGVSASGPNTSFIHIKGLHFGDQGGTVTVGEQTAQASGVGWSNTQINGFLPSSITTAQDVIVTTLDGQSTQAVACTLDQGQVDFKATLSCRGVDKPLSIADVEIKEDDATSSASVFKKESQPFSADGRPTGLLPKLIDGKNYKFLIKAPFSLRKTLPFTAAKGTTALEALNLPLGDVYPAAGDCSINSLDRNELIRQLTIAKDAERTADLNRDGRVNSVDYSCLVSNFNKPCDRP